MEVLTIWRTLFNFKYTMVATKYIPENRILSQSGILMDKTVDKKLMYIPNDNKQNNPLSRLEFLV